MPIKFSLKEIDSAPTVTFSAADVAPPETLEETSATRLHQGRVMHGTRDAAARGEEDSALNQLVHSPQMQSAAHPETISDVANLILAPMTLGGAAAEKTLPQVGNLVKSGANTVRAVPETVLNLIRGGKAMAGNVVTSPVVRQAALAAAENLPIVGRPLRIARQVGEMRDAMRAAKTGADVELPAATVAAEAAAPAAALPGESSIALTRRLAAENRAASGVPAAGRPTPAPVPSGPAAVTGPRPVPPAADVAEAPFKAVLPPGAGPPASQAGLMSPTAINSELAIQARRAKVVLSADQKAQAVELVRAGRPAADVVRELGQMPAGQATTSALRLAAKAKVKLTAPEVAAARDLIRTGMTPEQSVAAVVKIRELPAAFRELPTDAAMRDSLSVRNATGSWAKTARPGPPSGVIKDVYPPREGP